MTLFQAWILVMALAIDAFVCSFGYGISKIKIPFKSVMVINAVCTSLLAIGLFLGAIINNFLSEDIAGWIAFVILFLLGISKIFDSAIKRLIRKNNGIDKDFKFSFFNLGFIFKVYANPEEADVDHSKELTPREAMPLAIAVGLDGLSVGIGIGITLINPFLILGLSLFSDIIAVILGAYLGNRLARKINWDLSWIAGVILILIAILEVL